MAVVAIVLGWCLTLPLAAVAISDHRHIKRMEHRMRALGVVETIARQAGGTPRPAEGRHLHSVTPSA